MAAKRPNVHVTYDRGREQWKVQSAGASRAAGYYDTKDAARDRGQGIARARGCEYIGHRKDDGRIHERDTYGHDPFPPKG